MRFCFPRQNAQTGFERRPAQVHRARMFGTDPDRPNTTFPRERTKWIRTSIFDKADLVSIVWSWPPRPLRRGLLNGPAKVFEAGRIWTSTHRIRTSSHQTPERPPKRAKSDSDVDPPNTPRESLQKGQSRIRMTPPSRKKGLLAGLGRPRCRSPPPRCSPVLPSDIDPFCVVFTGKSPKRWGFAQTDLDADTEWAVPESKKLPQKEKGPRRSRPPAMPLAAAVQGAPAKTTIDLGEQTMPDPKVDPHFAPSCTDLDIDRPKLGKTCTTTKKSSRIRT